MVTVCAALACNKTALGTDDPDADAVYVHEEPSVGHTSPPAMPPLHAVMEEDATDCTLTLCSAVEDAFCTCNDALYGSGSTGGNVGGVADIELCAQTAAAAAACAALYRATKTADDCGMRTSSMGGVDASSAGAAVDASTDHVPEMGCAPLALLCMVTLTVSATHVDMGTTVSTPACTVTLRSNTEACTL